MTGFDRPHMLTYKCDPIKYSMRLSICHPVCKVMILRSPLINTLAF